MLTVAWRGDTGAVLGSFIGVHVVTVIVAIIQVRLAIVGIRASPRMGIRVVEVKGASVNIRVARSGVTYRMSVTLPTSHSPMAWLNISVYWNVPL
jgi:hypothetical protein